jgi:16S rRNA (cytidine1402-2'-O)-methyltransferase
MADWGRLYVVATPIGNLADVTQRAATVLCRTRIVACEDTRRARKLLAHVGAGGAAPQTVVALHAHNEAGQSDELLLRLKAGDDVALISDAGTPLISDPGFVLVRAAWRAGARVVPLPGASAVTTALAASPIAGRRFRFEGFLPAKRKARRDVLGEILRSDVAVVFFEAPHRMRETLLDIAALGGGERPLLVCRELSKRFETLSFGSVGELLAAGVVLDRGEFTCILAPTEAAEPSLEAADAVLATLLAELPPGQAARLAAKISGASRAELYQRALSMNADRE